MRDHAPGRQRHHEVRAEEGELDQHRLRVVHREHGFQVRDQHVVEAGQRAPGEEHGAEHRDGRGGGEGTTAHDT